MADRIERVLVVTAHPDDSEFGAGGTVAKLVKEGKRVAYCILTNGDKGSGDRTMTPERLAAIRAEEQRNAARVLGVETVEFLGFRIASWRTRARRAWRSPRPSVAIVRTCSSRFACCASRRNVSWRRSSATSRRRVMRTR